MLSRTEGTLEDPVGSENVRKRLFKELSEGTVNSFFFFFFSHSKKWKGRERSDHCEFLGG